MPVPNMRLSCHASLSLRHARYRRTVRSHIKINKMELFSEEHIKKVGMEILKSIKQLADEIVQKYINPIGGIYSDNSMKFMHLKTLGPSLMHGYQEIPRVRELPNISFEVVNNPELNAVAIKTDLQDDYLVLLNNGLVREINSFIDFFINSGLNEYADEYQKNKE